MPGIVNMQNGSEAASGESQPRLDLKDQAHDNTAGNMGESTTLVLPTRSNDLPPEITHISEGFFPISKLVTRLAQLSHNQLTDTIVKLASMPLPPPQPPSANGGPGQKEEFDQCKESVAKKVVLNQAIQKMHGKWIKALIIADWSRGSKDVSKLIDLKAHLGQVMAEYELRLDQMINVKRDLTFARLPSPDLKTALHVLSTGDGSFFPDLQYIDPDPMTDEEMLKWVQNVNTLLTIRLNLDDYNNIPIHFRDYTIRDGRVVFSVEGEFEVELTIADEDNTKQLWFVDFRFKCSPAPSEISLSLRMYLETMVNSAIAKDNLTGCYKFLHEFVLTHKVNEMKRQAVELSKTSWSGALSIETLDRAFSVQYWPNHPGPNGSKHWIIVAVNSKIKKTAGWVNPKTTSTLSATWFRDGKPVKDEKIPFDSVNLSMENLVTTVLAKHIEYIFMSIYRKLALNKRYASGEARLAVSLDPKNPANSSLTMQCSHEESITVIIEPTTGDFKLNSHSKASLQAETKLNRMVDPAREGATAMDGIRWNFLMEEMLRKSGGTGWICFKNPLPVDDVRSVLKIRDTTFWSLCLQRKEMTPTWIIMCVLRAQGDEWYLCKVHPPTKTLPFRFAQGQPIQLNMSSLKADLSPKFWSSLSANIHQRIFKKADTPEPVKEETTLPSPRSYENQLTFTGMAKSADAIQMSRIITGASVTSGAKASEPSGTSSATSTNPEVSQSRRGPWAEDTITLIFDNVVAGQPVASSGPRSRSTPTPMWSSHCIVRVLDKKKFQSLGTHLSNDIRYNKQTGEFCIRLIRPMGTPTRPLLKPRLEAIDRIVDFLDAIPKAGPCVRCRSVALHRVAFTYSEANVRLDKSTDAAVPRWTVVLDLRKSDQIAVILDDKDPHQMVGTMITRIANQPGGLHTLVRTLPRTLAVMDAISQIINSSPERAALNMGVVRALHMSPGASSLIYHLASGIALRLDIKARVRAGAIWWMLERVALSDISTEEDVTARLATLFSTPDPEGRWLALGSGLATRGITHVKAMIKAADQQVWG